MDRYGMLQIRMKTLASINTTTPTAQIQRQAAALHLDQRFLRHPLLQHRHSQRFTGQTVELASILSAIKTIRQRRRRETTIAAFQIHTHSIGGPGHQHRIAAVTETQIPPPVRQGRRLARWCLQRHRGWINLEAVGEAAPHPEPGAAEPNGSSYWHAIHPTRFHRREFHIGREILMFRDQPQGRYLSLIHI